MRDQELVNAIRRLKVETGSLACMGCGHEHNCGVSGCAVMREAADRIANQSTNIAALQQEIEKLRGQNKQLREAAALVTKESAELLERRWIPVDGNLYPGDPNRAADGSGFNPFHTPAYVPNPAAPRNCCAGGFGSTKIGEEVENAETK